MKPTSTRRGGQSRSARLDFGPLTRFLAQNGSRSVCELPCVRRALEEHSRGMGIPVTREIALGLSRLRGPGSPLDAETRKLLEQAFRRDLTGVRIHLDSPADRIGWLAGTKALCIGNDILLGRDAVDSRGAVRPDILLHELAHASTSSQRQTVYFWPRGEHIKMTEEYAPEFFAEKWVLTSLSYASTIMDYRTTRLGAVIPPGAAYYLTDWIFNTPLGEIKPEGPEHGEGYNYTRGYSKGDCREENLRVQNQRLCAAVWYYNSLVTVLQQTKGPNAFADNIRAFSEQSRSTLQAIGRKYDGGLISTKSILINARKFLENLGDALHIAQDRGAHGEGVHGEGHSRKKSPIKKRTRVVCTDKRSGALYPFWVGGDPMDGIFMNCQSEEIPYNPDSPMENDQGLVDSYRQSRKVLEKFLNESGYQYGYLACLLGESVMPEWVLQLECEWNFEPKKSMPLLEK